MTIRVRLVIMCLVVALLPAVPLTLLVQSLLDKSFNVGLSETVEDALQSGMAVSRERFEEMRARFQSDVGRVVDELSGAAIDSVVVAVALQRAGEGHDGFVLAAPVATEGPDSGLRAFERSGTFRTLIKDTRVVGSRTSSQREDIRFFETENRTAQLAVWPAAGVLFFRQTDPEFLTHAQRLIEGRQIFAQLRLARGGLMRSFFYPFVIIYAVSVVLALALAMFIAERLADPLRRLVLGTNKVAGGDWSYRLDVEAGGETGKLVGAFNTMVARLDEQQRRLVDVEKMASWRDVARHLAHEIKNPLLPIRLTVEEIRDQYRGDDARYREFLDESTRVVGDEVDHLQQLVKSFSAFAKMPELKPSRGSLESLVADVARLYPQVSTTIEGSTPEFPFDSDQMRRVVMNLFDNAVSVDAADVRVRLGTRDGAAEMSFADDGPGIPEEHLARVFEPYFTTRKEGSGLGLAMLKNIVLLHGGTVAVDSDTGGTTFIIRLPLTGPPAGGGD
jgi:nitrogen fixation/metabolism regulation signal transduction histidine kinase